MRKVVRLLPCRLSLEEIASKAGDLSRVLLAIEERVQEKEEFAQTMDRVIKGLKKEAGRLAQVIHDGQEFREVACSDRWIFETATYEVWRNDTAERVVVRATTEEERKIMAETDLPEFEIPKQAKN